MRQPLSKTETAVAVRRAGAGQPDAQQFPVAWLKRSTNYESLIPDEWLNLSLAQRGLLESLTRVQIISGPLPDDVALLARRIGADVGDVEAAWPAVRQLLATDESGRLIHPATRAAVNEAAEACEKARQQRAAAGRASGSSRRARTAAERAPNARPTTVEHPLNKTERERTDVEGERESGETHAQGTQRVRVSNLRENHPPSNRFDDFWQRYPRKQRKDAACAEFISVVSADSEAAVFACLDRYLASDEVARNVVMNPDKWLYEQHRNAWAGDWPPAQSRGNPTATGERRRQAGTDESWRELTSDETPGKGSCGTCAGLIRLCGGMDFFPPDVEVRQLLIEGLHRLARNHDHAKAMIDRWLETQTVAPKIADLVNLAASVRAEKPTLPPGCDQCKGEPWVSSDRSGYAVASRCTCARGQALRTLDSTSEHGGA